MLVDMNAVTQCMVVSSPLCSGRLPINPNAADEQSFRASFLAFSSPLIGNVSWLRLPVRVQLKANLVVFQSNFDEC
jgi:hypothetical protein